MIIVPHPVARGANQAMQAARLGAQVDMIGRVGDDAYGRSLLQTAKEAGIDIAHVQIDEALPTAVGNVQLELGTDGKTENRIIVISGANMAITPDSITFLKECISDYDMVLLQLEIPMEVNEAVINIASEAGVPVLLNPAPAKSITDDILSKLTYLAPNETEAEILTGISIREKNGRISLEAAKKAATVLLGQGVKNVIITLGDAGALFATRESFEYCPSVRDITAVDPTAAGDSFIGAFAVAKAAEKASLDALRFACTAAAITVSRKGAQPSLPALDEVNGLLKKIDWEACEMITAESKKYLNNYAKMIKQNVSDYSETLISDFYKDAVALILDVQSNGGRVHVTGIGKPAHVANYAASLLSSTGTPTYFLHGTEAVHGSCGQLVEGDVVICISNSGETSEMKSTVLAIKNNGCYIIGITGNADSWLAKQSDVHLLAHVDQEGGPMNRAPISSVLVECMVLQGLGVILQSTRGLTAQEYVRRHPGGTLGQLRENETAGGV